jgi:hypothetical protein
VVAYWQLFSMFRECRGGSERAVSHRKVWGKSRDGCLWRDCAGVWPGGRWDSLGVFGVARLWSCKKPEGAWRAPVGTGKVARRAVSGGRRSADRPSPRFSVRLATGTRLLAARSCYLGNWPIVAGLTGGS